MVKFKIRYVKKPSYKLNRSNKYHVYNSLKIICLMEFEVFKTNRIKYQPCSKIIDIHYIMYFKNNLKRFIFELFIVY